LARLVLINGLPGSGKSTLARRLADEHPLTLVLEIDHVVTLLGVDDSSEADPWPAARRIALAMARQHLADGHDVVVPQYLGRLDFVHDLDRLARDVDATFVEVALRPEPADVAARRFRDRATAAATQQHVDAARALAEGGSTAEFERMRAGLLEVVDARPSTRVVDAPAGDVEGSYAGLVDALAG
jgi:predicted kinase